MFEKQLQAFFCRAMLAGWAGKGEKSDIDDMPGYKRARYAEGDLLLVDVYCTTALSEGSAGTTTIFFNGQPVWWMCYFGKYEEKAIPFLKSALQRAYEKGSFQGGRGPGGEYIYNGMRYQNQIEKNDFSDFSGKESVYNSDGNLMGWHRYHGFSLV